MLGLLGSRIGRIIPVIGAGLAAIAGFKLWLAAHDAAIAREARAGYVLLAEKTAAEAKAQELQRQANAASQALEVHRKRLVAAELAEQQKSAEREQEILAYEIRLSQANRRCLLDRNDLDFLQRDRAAPDSRSIRSRPSAGGRQPS